MWDFSLVGANLAVIDKLFLPHLGARGKTHVINDVNKTDDSNKEPQLLICTADGSAAMQCKISLPNLLLSCTKTKKKQSK